jgi:hypothetical protein
VPLPVAASSTTLPECSTVNELRVEVGGSVVQSMQSKQQARTVRSRVVLASCVTAGMSTTVIREGNTRDCWTTEYTTKTNPAPATSTVPRALGKLVSAASKPSARPFHQTQSGTTTLCKDVQEQLCRQSIHLWTVKQHKLCTDVYKTFG